MYPRETRIRRDALIHIEEEDHEKLPDIVFVKGFLRAYAKAIGADGDEAVTPVYFPFRGHAENYHLRLGPGTDRRCFLAAFSAVNRRSVLSNCRYAVCCFDVA